MFGGSGCARGARPQVIDDGGFSRAVIARNDGSACVARLPLSVAATFEGHALLVPFFRAVASWSDALELRPLVRIADNTKPNLILAVAPPRADKPDRLAECEQRCVGGQYVQTIRVFSATPDALVEDVLVHELGHAIGVIGTADEWGHSPSRVSIMHYTVGDEHRAPRGQRILDEDVAAFRRAWGL
jgi:hypothetical protein